MLKRYAKTLLALLLAVLLLAALPASAALATSGGETGGETGTSGGTTVDVTGTGQTGTETGSGESAEGTEPAESPEPEVVVEEPEDTALAITKDPTGETVAEGESAVFIARADNATEIVWLLVSPDGQTTYYCADAPGYFPPLQVTGLGTERLELINIPRSLDGWRVQAMFNGQGGPLYSKSALLTVTEAQLAVPTIVSQPRDAAPQPGTSVTLSVGASAPEGELHYQWYRASDAGRNVGGQAIVGATGPTYTPAESVGTQYYYVTVWAVSGNRSSNSVSSSVAAVSYPAAELTPAPETTPEIAPEIVPEPAVETPAPTAQPSAARHSGSTAMVVAAVVLLLGALASVGVYIYLRHRDMDED